MILAKLLTGFPSALTQDFSAGELKFEITGITADSREIVRGCVFVAVKGQSQDGHQFIAAALASGAALVVGEVAQTPGEAGSGRYLQVSDSRAVLARLAANFYGNPSHGMTMVGVTGTSGKTTTTYLIESVLKAAGFEVGVIGTVNFRLGSRILPSTHTTPGAVELQRILAEMKSQGCTAVVMEVSSHALKQHRSAYIAFDAMVFTNLTAEHLDFHPDMEDYYRTKKILFTEYVPYAVESGKRPCAAVNFETVYGRRLLTELKAERMGENLETRSYGLSGQEDIAGQGLKISLDGIHGKAAGIRVDSKLTGKFNAYNILAALAVGKGLNLAADSIEKGIAGLTHVPGRLERVPNQKGITILVDYAHKPDALENVLTTLRDMKIPGQRIISVIGCGGDRDRKKRPVMGKMAVELSDYVCITSDNPRTEDPKAIIQEILAGVQGHSNFVVEPDRRKAIFTAIQAAKKGDIVLIAGKGHENYQIIAAPGESGGVRKIHFDDCEVAQEALQAD